MWLDFSESLKVEGLKVEGLKVEGLKVEGLKVGISTHFDISTFRLASATQA